MSRASDYLESSNVITKIDQNRQKYLIIHYSSESFYDKEDGLSKKIANIAVRRLDSGQTDLFAIHKFAELNRISFDRIDENYEYIERKMLDAFFEFVENNNDKYWIHWNMRDTNFGFKAIEHRYRVLGGSPVLIPDDHKVDLASLLTSRYSDSYVSHPRMENLYKINNISPKDLMNGKEEAEAFEKGEYIKLSHSTSSKVNLFANFLTRLFDNELVVRTSKKEIFGTSLQGFVLRYADSWWYKALAKGIPFLTGGIIGFFLERLLENLLEFFSN